MIIENQHNGVHRADWEDLCKHMPDITGIILDTFPDDVMNFTWDVKVHMLMPNQYPCMPSWHYDNVPRVDGKQDFSLVKLDKPMYLWVSGLPVTEFKSKNGILYKIKPKRWIKFNQSDLHRGNLSKEFTWRMFIRATHKDILAPNEKSLRRHSQVYLDSSNFSW
jgi:hypothetical protein